MTTTSHETLDAVTLPELSGRWKCSISTLRRKIRNGILPTIRIPGSTKIWIPSDAVIHAERPRVRTLDAPTASTLNITPQTLTQN